MARYILGLPHGSGYRLMYAIGTFSHQIGLQTNPARTNAIYHEVISQVLAIMHHDRQTFLYDMMSLPNWATIMYTEDRAEFSHLKQFLQSEIQAFSLTLQTEWIRKIPPSPFPSLYMLETASPTLITFTEYHDSEKC